MPEIFLLNELFEDERKITIRLTSSRNRSYKKVKKLKSSYNI